MNSVSKIHPGELICIIILITAYNLIISPGNPAFAATTYNPFYISIIFFTCLYGTVPGLVTFLLAYISSIIIILYTAGPVSDPLTFLLNSQYYDRMLLFATVSLISVFLLGAIRDYLGKTLSKLKFQKKNLLKIIQKLRQEMKAVSLINDEYQERVLGQQNSLIALYNTMVGLNSLNLENIYPNILEAVVRFTGVTRCSLWKYHSEKKEIELLATYGWPGDEKHYAVFPSDNNILGWVARNNVLFSAKMLNKYKNLKELDAKDNLITVPLNVENSVWGIINIEEMPFIKYNLYSEQLTMMIADMVAPAIHNAQRFVEITKRGETDPVTGFNSLDELFIILKEEFNRARASSLNLSFFIIELNNFDQFVEHYNKKDVLLLLKDVSKVITMHSKGTGMVFQYKDINQFAVIIPGIDYDGAAVFCLDVIEINSTQQYRIDNEIVVPEILIAYSTLRPNHDSELDMLQLAENLLLMQKI